MKPERVARLAGRWPRIYTRGAPASVARRRIEEIDADLRDQIAHERAAGSGERSIALGLLSRTLRGLAADAAWRGGQVRARTAYRLAVALAVATPLFLFWLMGAVGVIGVEGDPSDLMFLGVFAVGIAGALLARFRPRGAPRARALAGAMLAMAAAQGLVGAIALIAGKHEAAISSLAEILGLTGMFVALFLASAWLFRQAARRSPPADAE